jgi:hypothetical protein
MFIPSDAAAIEFDASSLVEPVAGDESPGLAAYFVPVQLDDLGNLTPANDRSTWLPIGRWLLSGDASELQHALPFDSPQKISLPIPSTASELGGVGSIRFEVTVTSMNGDVADLIELDNVRLITQPRQFVTITAPNQVESRP